MFYCHPNPSATHVLMCSRDSFVQGGLALIDEPHNCEYLLYIITRTLLKFLYTQYHSSLIGPSLQAVFSLTSKSLYSNGDINVVLINT